MIRKSHLILAIFVFFIHCTAPVKNLYPPARNGTDNKKIYIVKHAWHTGIVVNRREADYYLPALTGEFSGADFLEVGWGDLDYYMAERGNVFLALKAVLWPTKSTIRIMGFNKHPLLIFGEDRIVEVTISDQGFINLIRYINNSFAFDKDSQNIKFDTNVYGSPSRYYLSREKYHGFKTCNVWTAKAIRKTGYPITPFYALRAKNVLYQIRRYKNKS